MSKGSGIALGPQRHSPLPAQNRIPSVVAELFQGFVGTPASVSEFSFPGCYRVRRHGLFQRMKTVEIDEIRALRVGLYIAKSRYIRKKRLLHHSCAPSSIVSTG